MAWRRRLVLELVGSLHDDVDWAGDQVMRLEQPVDRSLRHKIAGRISESRGQFPWRQLGLIQCQLNDPLAYCVRDAVPDALWPW